MVVYYIIHVRYIINVHIRLYVLFLILYQKGTQSKGVKLLLLLLLMLLLLVVVVVKVVIV